MTTDRASHDTREDQDALLIAHRTRHHVRDPGPYPALAEELRLWLDQPTVNRAAFEARLDALQREGRLSVMTALEWRACVAAHGSVRDVDASHVHLNQLASMASHLPEPGRANALVSVHRHRARLHMLGRQHAEALSCMLRALELELSPANIQLALCVLVRMRRLDDAGALISRVREQTSPRFFNSLLLGIRADPDLILLSA